MIKYSMDKVIAVLQEVSKKFILTESTKLKKIKYSGVDHHYLITLQDDSRHIVPQELINAYIENFGEKGGLEIAGHLRHCVELEQSVFETQSSNSDEVWDGDINDVIDYLSKKEEDEADE